MRTIARSHSRSFLYARVSTGAQADNGVGLDTQTCEGGHFCRAKGYPDPEVRIEVESGGEEKLERRVELKRILADIRPGDVLVCYDLSRWSRDQVFAVHSVRSLREKGSRFAFGVSRSLIRSRRAEMAAPGSTLPGSLHGGRE